MLDFSYKKDVMVNILESATKVVILDHHETAQSILGELFYDEQYIDVLDGKFDMNKSGAMLAWEYFHPDLSIPSIVRYVQDRDLWKFEYGGITKAVSSYLFSLPYDFNVVSNASQNIENNLNDVLTQGNAILRQHDKDVLELSANKFLMEIGGHEIWACNVPYTLCSDMAHLLADGKPFGATFYYDGSRGKFIFSLRSTEDGADVSEIAKTYGGGGHKHAAGFEVEPSYNIKTHFTYYPKENDGL